MNCPKCKANVSLEETKCANCSEEYKKGHMVKILITGDKPLITITKSVLTDAEVEFFVKGEGLQDLIGLGSFGTGYNVATGPMELYVSEEDAEAVQMLIDELEQNQELDMEAEGEEEEDREF